MADLLHQSLYAMSIEEEEEPLTLPDSPRFRVFDGNSTSLLGRLLNPECQPMAKMMDYMPTAWRVYGRVRGIALSRDRFQFIFQREEDLQTVLNDRPWSYNHWAMVLERWTADPGPDFLRFTPIWIRIKNIPSKFFTGDTMYKLASEIGHVEEIAYDPKVSHTKDYIRALITFDTEKPAKESRKLTVSKDATVTIKFEYERIHKKCYHCFHLTHEKFRCPMLRKGPKPTPPTVATPSCSEKSSSEVNPLVTRKSTMEGPPGFPPLFPELPPQERKAALLYISHSDTTERQARIMRVQQAIEDQGQTHVATLTRFTADLDKGKGHVFHYPEIDQSPRPLQRLRPTEPLPIANVLPDQDDVSETESSEASAHLVPPISTGFQIGSSAKTSSAGDSSGSKSARRRLPSWKRKAQGSRGSARNTSAVVLTTPPMESGGKRKPDTVPLSPSKKLLTPTSISVASNLKPLLPQ
ncbi:uncharacterized protein LOC108807987 [Raphanus sativus]|uniref:Uncharacterized protein LOC108807987 n=1 Tax=Raphanus sativus TaxID=3726 RepID=A0A6J0JL16_RAPSA|nr:uncharacterized protein LOC108807987 [Raphanus sativus]